MASGRNRAFYSGKHKAHGLNVQVIGDPIDRLVWISPPLPGARHDLGAAREHGIIDALTAHEIPAVADDGATRSESDAAERPDQAQQADPAARRPIPPPDATAVAFERAQQVLREVAGRQQAEQAVAAHAAELESEDERLRTELARQAAYDTDEAFSDLYGPWVTLQDRRWSSGAVTPAPRAR